MSGSGIFRIILRFALMSVGVYLLIALGLILSQKPAQELPGDTIDFSSLSADERQNPVPLESYQARDGTSLGYRHYPAQDPDAPLLIFIHGSGWHSGAYDGLARQLAASGKVEVVLPDLRGHGPNTQTRGDVAYIGQLEDDIADLAAAMRKPGQQFVLGGHSSGGGLVIRYAGGRHGAALDGAVLLAPYLKYDAPTMRPDSGGWARALTRRIIGLTMLNNVGITGLNRLTAIQFKFSDEVLNGTEAAGATTSYSYRLNTSYAPRSDYLSDIAALPSFLLIAGTDDEAFIADAYEPLMQPVNADGRYELLDNQSHLGIIADERAVALVLDYIRARPQ